MAARAICTHGLSRHAVCLSLRTAAGSNPRNRRQFACHCGQPPDRILEIGLTSDAKIVVHFWCSNCQRVFYMSQALDECRQECPPPDAEADSLSAAVDAHFLRSIGVAVSE